MFNCSKKILLTITAIFIVLSLIIGFDIIKVYKVKAARRAVVCEAPKMVEVVEEIEPREIEIEIEEEEPILIGYTLEPYVVMRDLGEPKDEIYKAPIEEKEEEFEEESEIVEEIEEVKETEVIPSVIEDTQTQSKTETIPAPAPVITPTPEPEIVPEQSPIEEPKVEVEVETESTPVVNSGYYAGGAAVDVDFLAKLIYAEGGAMSWNGQVYLCSAILNLCDLTGKSVWQAGHTYNMFSVAYMVDSVSPNQTQYDVINYVMNGGRVPGVAFFRTDYYHSFGTPLCAIDNVYFSTP